MRSERIQTKSADTTLFWLALASSILGLVFILDSGYVQSMRIGQGLLPRPFLMQAIMLGVGVGAFFLVRRANPQKLSKRALVWMGVAFLGLILVEVVGVSKNGAKRWLGTDTINLQPAEFMKVGAILYLSYALARKKAWQATWEKRKRERGWVNQVLVPKLERLWPAFVILLAVALVEHEKDLGTASVILATSIAMFFSAPVTWKSVTTIGLILILGLVGFVWKEPYRLERFTVHPHRWEREYINDETYQTTQSELAMVSGKLVGVGFGSGRAKYMLPATTSDFIMATVGEECGFWGPAVCLALIGGICFKLLQNAKQQKDRFRALFLTGTAWWLGIQACTNLMMANATLPAIGIPFPFISAGGSSLVALWIAIGLCDRLSSAPEPSKEVVVEGHRHGWRNRRTRLSGT
ncbi:MAG: FtsW/RodA/SpoVE family cell cycle protein [Armatimonadetes bacterium]|nr:FtsW/RodA/SpoVE family cell cycle protein [Armatimonadota bacterium]MBS1725568.1 FtsW/RodA/SpoVE family cell cycle protein [Armatimonadota bacterium]